MTGIELALIRHRNKLAMRRIDRKRSGTVEPEIVPQVSQQGARDLMAITPRKPARSKASENFVLVKRYGSKAQGATVHGAFELSDPPFAKLSVTTERVPSVRRWIPGEVPSAPGGPETICTRPVDDPDRYTFRDGELVLV